MAIAEIDGITTHYDVVGSGPPLLMFSPGGFNATMANWTTQGVYSRFRPLEHLSRHYTCIAFDRREAGRSGGRVERVTWAHYVAQGKGLLDHLGIEQAHLIGGCQGCPPAAAFAVSHPESTLSLLLYWPVGGARYRIRNHAQFEQHAAYVAAHGLEQVVELAASHDEGFSRDPRIGPWGPVLRHDRQFAESYVQQDAERYGYLVGGMARTLFDRDTAPGPEPEDLLRLDVPALIVPGQDAAHATSAARYLQECIPGAEYWDVATDAQTADTVPGRLLAFLNGVSSGDDEVSP